MAFAAGKAGVFKIDDAAAGLTDLSPYLDNVDFPREVAALETTAFGKTSRNYIVGLINGTISISGKWDGGVDPAPDVTLSGVLGQAATLSFEYGPEGSTGGMIKYSGECILTSYRISTPVDGVVSFSADFQITDNVTRGTW